jgi:protein involved in polysaccharide export with SLBB domain
MQKDFYGGMIIRLMTTSSVLLFLLIVAPSVAQDTPPFLTQIRNSTPKQQASYVIEARKRGYSLVQLEGLAKAQGATLQDLSLLRNAWAGNQQSSENQGLGIEMQNQDSLGFGNDTEMFMFGEEKEESDIFGSAFFANQKITETPQFYVATPAGYRLGPTDEISIDVWGASENRYEVTLSRQGVVRIDRLKPMYLSGLTIAAAERKIRNEFSSIYTGLSPDASNESKVYLDVNLQKARSIVVNITGSVEAPGTYTISGFSSVLNALYAAGGPSESGSYRDISIIRNGKLAHTIDLYDYFVKGTFPSFFLNDQDVIVVSPHHNRIKVDGAFKTTGRFETVHNETVEDLLSYVGGFSSEAYKKAVYVDRVLELEREIIKIEQPSYTFTPLRDGDLVEAKSVSDKYTNKVSVSGEVYLPGNYPLNESPTLSALLKSSNGLTPSAYPESAILYRSKQGYFNEIKTINLLEIVSKTQDIQLQPNDSLVVISMENIKTEKKVDIQGIINEPGEYPFFEGMTAGDLVLIANGFDDRANTDQIELYTNVTDLDQNKRINSRTFSFDEANEVELNSSDLMVIRAKPGYQPTTFVTLKGEVSRPGTYPIINENYTLYDLYFDAGKALTGANLSGVSIERKISNQTKSNIQETEDSLNILFVDEEDTDIKIGVNFEKVLSSKGNFTGNLLLRPNDVIFFPKKDSTVSVLGAVQRETAMPYTNGISLREAVIKSGGVTQSANYKNAYVVYQNGDVKGTKRLLFFNIRPRLQPGAVVVVPVKDEKRAMTVQEIIGMSSAIASLALLVTTIIGN